MVVISFTRPGLTAAPQPPPCVTNYVRTHQARCADTVQTTYYVRTSPGARCAMSIQPVLHELGCLPVSKMVHLPEPQASKHGYTEHSHSKYSMPLSKMVTRWCTES